MVKEDMEEETAQAVDLPPDSIDGGFPTLKDSQDEGKANEEEGKQPLQEPSTKGTDNAENDSKEEKKEETSDIKSNPTEENTEQPDSTEDESMSEEADESESNAAGLQHESKEESTNNGDSKGSGTADAETAITKEVVVEMEQSSPTLPTTENQESSGKEQHKQKSAAPSQGDDDKSSGDAGDDPIFIEALLAAKRAAEMNNKPSTPKRIMKKQRMGPVRMAAGMMVGLLKPAGWIQRGRQRGGRAAGTTTTPFSKSTELVMKEHQCIIL